MTALKREILTFLLAASVVNRVECEEDVNAKFFKATRHFAVELLKTTFGDGNNVVISPLSVSAILALLQQGAGGNTAAEFDQVLGVDAETTKIGYKNLSSSFTKKSDGVTLEWGNKVYTKAGLTVDPKFVSDAESSFRTQFEEVDFTGQPSDAIADLMNQWISESTHGQIKEVIEPHMVNADAIMLFVNVMYFKGSWLNRFREKNTRIENFDKSPTESVAASFMYQKNKFYAGKNASLGVKWVELPFEDKNYKMIFVLPMKRHSLDKVTAGLTGDDLYNIISYGYLTEVRLRVPKFKLSGKFSLIELLQSLGLRDAFTEASNLKGISPEPVHVSDAFHQANIEVDERGSTASAATVVTISRMLTSHERFRLDQPFLFFIVDSANRIPVFAGRVVDPTVS